MKKLMGVSLVVLLLLAFAAAGYSEETLTFTASGFIDAQTEYMRNDSFNKNTSSSFIYNTMNSSNKPGGAAFNDEMAYLDSRCRLKFNAAMGKNLSGTIFFEMNATTWGNGAGAPSGSKWYGNWNMDQVAIQIKNIFVDFAVPYVPVPVTFRVGGQPLSIRPGIFMYSDGMGVQAGIKIDPITINPLWFKPLEGQTQAADDADAYGLDVRANLGTFTVGGYGLFFNMNSYPFFDASLNQGTQDARIWWFGLYADGKAGPVNLNFDLVYDDGSVKSKLTPEADKVEYSGWASRAKIDYPWEKFNFGLIGAYASGSDTQKTSNTGFAGSSTSIGTQSHRVGSYIVPPNSETGGLGDGLVFYGSELNRGDTGIAYTYNTNALTRGGIGGTWYGLLYASYKATPDWKVTARGLYIGDTTKNGNTFGTAVKPGTSVLRDDSQIGWELDLINEIQIWKNLTYAIGAGYLWAGSAMDFKSNLGNFNASTSNPWIITSRLLYTF